MRHVFAFLLVAMVAGCAQTTDWDYDKTAQFALFKTYAFAPTAKLPDSSAAYQVNGLMDKRLRDAISSEMSKQGFSLTDPTNADVLVNYHVNVDKKVTQDTINTTYAAHWNYWGWGVQSQTTTHEYEVGTVVIDIVNNGTQQLVWRGVKEGRLKKKQTPEARTETVNQTVVEILANFPPKAKL